MQSAFCIDCNALAICLAAVLIHVAFEQVIEPQVKAYLYTWGEGRNTAEGEHIPVRIESLDIGYIDGQLLLPLIEEHTIDERSPLCGHTYMSLKAVRGCAGHACKLCNFKQVVPVTNRLCLDANLRSLAVMINDMNVKHSVCACVDLLCGCAGERRDRGDI